MLLVPFTNEKTEAQRGCLSHIWSSNSLTSNLPSIVAFSQNYGLCGEEGPLTLNEEEEGDDAHGSGDDAWHHEGQAPLPAHPDASDQGAQDVAHGRMGIPDAHDEAPPGRKERRQEGEERRAEN